MTRIEASEKKAEFRDWLDEEMSVGCTTDDVVVTADTVECFEDACATVRRIDQADWHGTPVTVLLGTQRKRGERRKDIYIANLGDLRLVVVF